MTPIEIKILFFKSVCPWLSSNQQNDIIHALYLWIPELFHLVHIMFSTIGKRLLSKAYWRSENFLTHSRLILNQKKKRKKKQAYKQTTYWHFSPLHTWIPDNMEKIRMSEIKCQGSVLHELIGSYSQLDETLCTWCAHMCRKKSTIVENLMSRRTIWLETEYLYNQF